MGPPNAADHAPSATYGLSVREAFKGKGVLITGATGYLGSLALEQLLRVAGEQVGPVYLLVRGRAGRTPVERIGRLLGSGLFHAVRQQQPQALAKVVVLEGDISLPDLGISAAALQEVVANVRVVLHSAASIALEDPIQTTLRANFVGTQHVLRLAADRLTRGSAVVHVSTAFVAMNQPHGSTVKEQLSPLMFGDMPVDAERLAAELLGMAPEAADVRATVLCRMWDLPNTYLLGKHLTEALVGSYAASGALPVAVVRPSLVAALAGAPYPGYVGNLAGPSGYMTAFALGFFSRNSPAWHSHHLLDSVPGDVAAAVILAAAAALASGITTPEQLLQAAAAVPSAGQCAMTHGSAGGDGGGVGVTGATGTPPGTLASGADVEGGGQGAPTHGSDPLRAGLYGAVASELAAGGRLANGAGAGATAPDTHRGAAPPSGPAELPHSAAAPGGQLLVFHAATSTTSPVLHGEAYDMAYRFFTAHKPRFRFLRSYPPPEPDYTPVPWKVALKTRLTSAKVVAAAGLLRCFGQDRVAHKLQVGLVAWRNANSVKHDKTLFFSVRYVLALERLLAAGAARDEAAALPVVWRGEWRPFVNTYMAAVCQLFMGYPAPPSTPQLPHGFTLIPHQQLPAHQLPRLAGTTYAAMATGPTRGSHGTHGTHGVNGVNGVSGSSVDGGSGGSTSGTVMPGSVVVQMAGAGMGRGVV